MASSDYLLYIAGIPGESNQKFHEGWMELQNWSWGETNSGSSDVGAGAGAGKVSMQDFQFTIDYGISSPKLFLYCAAGAHIPMAILHIRKAGGEQQVFVEWKFTDILISSYHTGGSGGGFLPTDKVTFNFTKIEMEYKPQKPDGTLGAGIKAGYDIKKGQKV
ncbi:type VI secretion protein [Bryobacterales bacterium F-183]|nr:type VI secretion protein [Bryobacterales bacterium F-183]